MSATKSILTLGMAAIAASQAFATTIALDIQRTGANDGRRDINLRSVTVGPDEIYNSFKFAQGVRDFTYNTQKPNRYRVVAGPDTTIANKRTVLGDNNLTGQEVNKSTFLNRATEVFQNTNLNHFVDLQSNSAPFGITLDYRNNPLQDKLFFFERGQGGANSWVVISAVDADGKQVGRNFLVDPFKMKDIGQKAAVYSSGAQINFQGTQDLSFLALDIKRDLGVNQADFIRVALPELNRTYGNGKTFTGTFGGDLAPDFKIVGSAEAIPEPATMTVLALAAAAAAARKRRQAKA